MTKSCSPLPHIKDKESGLLFLLDSGAEISLVKPLPHEHRNQQASNALVTVNGAPIATFGFRTMYISFDKVTTFRWIFVIADVSNNIIGTDFLKHFDLSLDFASMKLVRAGCNSRWELQTKSIAHISAPKTFLPRDKYLKLLASFPDLTTPNKHKPVKHSVVHHIVTKGYPSSSRPRQLSLEKLEFVKKEIDYLLESGIISRSESAVSSALHLVPKGQPGNFRLVGDYRKLNQQTVPDRYSTPSVTHLLHRLQGSCIFSKVDLVRAVRAYHQIPVAKESRHKTAITTPIGLFEYNFLPFGLRNASSTFQRFIDQVCHSLPYVLPYIDDIIIFSRLEEEHLEHLRTFSKRLDKHGIVSNATKSEFGKTELKFLGHLVTKEGIRRTKQKIEAISKFPIPSTTKQLRKYIGMIQYYHRFVPHAAELLGPLIDMLKGKPKTDKKLVWTSDCEAVLKLRVFFPKLHY